MWNVDNPVGEQHIFLLLTLTLYGFSVFYLELYIYAADAFINQLILKFTK